MRIAKAQSRIEVMNRHRLADMLPALRRKRKDGANNKQESKVTSQQKLKHRDSIKVIMRANGNEPAAFVKRPAHPLLEQQRTKPDAESETAVKHCTGHKVRRTKGEETCMNRRATATTTRKMNN